MLIFFYICGILPAQTKKECFFMKKTFKILTAMLRIATMRSISIIAIIAAIVFSMAACKDDEDYPDPPKQFLQVDGIPSTYINKYGIILLSPPDSTEINIYSSLEKINSTLFSFPLYKNNDPWEGNGNYCVKILIFDNATTDQWTYAGVTPETNITNSTVITWSSFVRK
jgi:hypothetical protein